MFSMQYESSQLADFFQHHQMSEQRKELLSRNPLILCEVVDNLGGIDAIFELCLNNESYCKQHIKVDNMKRLVELLSTTTNCDNNAINCSNTQRDKNPQTNKRNIHDDNPPNNEMKNDQLQSTLNKTTAKQVISPLLTKYQVNQFAQSRLIYNVDCQNNLYFKYLPYNYASNLYYKMLLNTKFRIFLVVLIGVTYD